MPVSLPAEVLNAAFNTHYVMLLMGCLSRLEMRLRR